MFHGQCHFEAGQDVGWDQRRFAAPAHQQFSKFPDGGPALEASWSHPTLNKAMALSHVSAFPIARLGTRNPVQRCLTSRMGDLSGAVKPRDSMTRGFL